jgi:EAL domain-containing protein (putative c-di-GMP-specific phosphodiesterase class I)
MKSACAFARKLTNMAYADTYISVNVSAKQLACEDFVPMVRAALDEAAIPPVMLKLEITETILMDSECLTTNIARLKELKDIGVRIALDDFGTGYSSLTYLKELPIDVVKIDKSFVDDLTVGGKNAPLMGSIIALAHNLGLKVVAEGVETEEQRNLLQEWQCDAIQGYLISRPLPEAEVVKVLASLE